MILETLAAWRLSHLLAKEEGPFGFFCKFRELSERIAPDFAEGLECEWCNSVWIGFFFFLARRIFGKKFDAVVLPLAISASVVFLSKIEEKI